MMTISEQIELVRQAETLELFQLAQTALMYVCLAALGVMLAFALVRFLAPYLTTALAAWRRLGIVGQILLTPALVTLLVYGSTKREIITDFNVENNPDSVICTWDETTNTISTVFIQRRLKGATEDEAWETIGLCNGGVKAKTIDGFSIDKDYEYRAKYIYTE